MTCDQCGVYHHSSSDKLYDTCKWCRKRATWKALAKKLHATQNTKVIELLRKVATAEPTVGQYNGGGEDIICVYCSYYEPGGRYHDNDCPYVMAQGIVTFLDGGDIS